MCIFILCGRLCVLVRDELLYLKLKVLHGDTVGGFGRCRFERVGIVVSAVAKFVLDADRHVTNI